MPSPQRSIYSYYYVPLSFRRKRQPVVARHWRCKNLSFLGQFFRDRFYEPDRWYKARIIKPISYPTMYVIDPAKIQKSLLERLEDMKVENQDPILNEKVDIGFKFDPEYEKTNKMSVRTKEQRAELEQLSRKQKLKINVDEFESTPEHLTVIEPNLIEHSAENYGIFKDLFHQDAYFYPVIPLRVHFAAADGSILAVYYGNVLKPEMAKAKPNVWFPSAPDSLWTLLMVNPDGNLYEESGDVLHWLVTNIRGNDVKSGKVLCEFIQPLPPKGTGYHRIAFVLFKQKGEIDLNEYRIENGSKYENRTFRTPRFYKKHEDILTPAGLCFFQTKWDSSCQETFQKTLNMAQPIYEFEWPEVWKPPQRFAEKYQPFQTYLDKYRPPRVVEQELVQQRLRRISPFKPDPPAEKYPNMDWFADRVDSQHTPTWLATERERARLRLGRFKKLYENRIPHRTSLE